MSVLSVSGQSAAEYAKPLREQQFLFISTFSKVLLVVLGVRMVTDEFRYGTTMPTFTFTPRRSTVVAAKLIVAGGVGLAFSVAGYAVLLGTASIVFAAHGHAIASGASSAQVVVGGILAGGLWTALGAGVGAIVRNQVTAIVGSLVWLMAVEQMVANKMGDLGGYLPGPAGWGLMLAPSLTGALLGGATLVGWTLGAGIVGSSVVGSRDLA
jgi:hypothetical protein